MGDRDDVLSGQSILKAILIGSLATVSVQGSLAGMAHTSKGTRDVRSYGKATSAGVPLARLTSSAVSWGLAKS